MWIVHPNSYDEDGKHAVLGVQKVFQGGRKEEFTVSMQLKVN